MDGNSKWKIFKTIAKSVWPSNDPKTKGRVFLAVSLLVAGKVTNVSVPILFKSIIDTYGSSSSSSKDEANEGGENGKSDLPLSHSPNSFNNIPPSKSTAESSNIPSLQSVMMSSGSLLIAYGACRFSTSMFLELRNLVTAKISQRAIRNLSLKTMRHLFYLPHSYHLQQNTGALSRNLERGSRGVQFLLNSALIHVIPTGLEVGMVCYLLSRNFGDAYALATLSTMAVYTGFTFVITGWRTQFRKDMNQAESNAAARLTDSLINYESVKHFGNESFELQRYDQELYKFEQASLKTTSSLGLLNIGQNAIFSVALTGIMYMGSLGIEAGTLTVGDLVMMNGLVFQLSLPLNFLGTIYRELKQSLVDMNNLISILSVPSSTAEDAGKRDFKLKSGKIEFRNVSFSYPGSDHKYILDNVSFVIEPGTKVAFVGHSGCGKSTILKLIFGFYTDYKGSILVDDQDVREISIASLRRHLGIVAQDMGLFHQSIYYNIAYGDPEGANLKRVRESAKRAQLDTLIDSLPMGYETSVGDRGLGFSGGERQRLALARMFIRKPGIILLDEATSALDAKTARQILSILIPNNNNESSNTTPILPSSADPKPETVIIISHQLTPITNCDQIIVMDRGRIVQSGRHQDLLLQHESNIYREMWNLQQEKEEGK